MGCKIVAATCMATNHALFHRRTFDVCIVDEASQITLPTALGPLLHARKFVLVGDHYQLPPLVQNRAALDGGLDVSLFRQLSEEHPEAVATLGKQYRMCDDIMSLSNTLIYSGQLRCGNPAVAERTLKVKDLSSLRSFHSATGKIQGCHGRCWLEDLLQPTRKAVLANTDALGKDAQETLTSGKNITNQLEATLSAQLVLSLLKLSVPAREIGVITLYRSQLALMRRLFRTAGIDGAVEIDSADRFQGRDKECIILSMVRSNEAGIVGDLLKDWRRVNVALTRAKSKLIILGSRRTLVNNELLSRMLAMLDERSAVVDLPRQADLLHNFNFSSQVAASLTTAALGTPSPLDTRSGSPKKMQHSPTKVLAPSQSKGNRTPMKAPKLIKGAKPKANARSSQIKEALMFEIFEDLTAEDI
jgi:DNA replication ATP-dependent helicase Dna2